MSSWCFGPLGFINVTGGIIATDPSRQMGIIYYPPLPSMNQTYGVAFSTATLMISINISGRPLSSIFPTALNISTCIQSSFTSSELWCDGSDNQTLSIIVIDKFEFNSTFRINAAAILMGGTLSSTYDGGIEFALNGTLWPNVMSTGNRWAEDIISMISNVTLLPFLASCSMGSSLSDFANLINGDDSPYSRWSTMLGMAMGAYSSAMFSTGDPQRAHDHHTGHDG